MRLAPSLALLAIAGLAAAADDQLNASLTAQVQTRAEWANAHDGNGNRYSPASNQATSPDTTDFYIRRFRLGAKGTYGDDLSFAMVMSMDNMDRDSNASATRTAKSQIHQASVTQAFRQGDIKHSVQVGYDYAFFNSAAFSASTMQQLPSDRATAGMMVVKGVGAGYRVEAPCAGVNVKWGADVQNNTGDDASAGGSEGMAYTTRLEVGKGLKRFTESTGVDFATINGWLVGLDLGLNKNDRKTTVVGTANNYSQDTLLFGVEALVHQDGWSALAEARFAKNTVHNSSAAPFATPNRTQSIYLLQVGYAMACCGKTVIEPAARVTRIDLDGDNPESASYGGSDYGTSGMQYEMGANWYLKGNNHKLSLDFIHWQAEAGTGPDVQAARANIVRLQHQLFF